MKSKSHTVAYRLFVLLLLPMSLACSQDSVEITPVQTEFGPNMLLRYPFTRATAPYILDLAIEMDINENVYLVATIDFINGSYVASPFSNDDFKGKFRLETAPSELFAIDELIEEFPRSSETIDPENNSAVNWVREKTTYKRLIHLNTNTDFKLGGKATFTIEPSCTFEEIPFMISCKNGYLSVSPAGC
jgi:hypothetical protein